MLAARDTSADALPELVRRALGVAIVASAPVPADLSTRRFVRLTLSGGDPARVVARIDALEDARIRPTGAAPEPPLEPIRALLERRGLPVPRCFGIDEAAGIALLEDLGEESLADLAGREPAAAGALLAEVVDALPALQATLDPGGVAAFQRRLDAPLLAFKAQLFASHGLALGLGRAPRESEAEVVRDAFAWIAERVAEAPARLAHRDLQSRNLLLRAQPDARGRRLGWIDLQGAFLAPPEYDLVCLLRDSYLGLAAEHVAQLCERVRPRLPDAPARDAFQARFDWLTLTRKGKDLARFQQAAAERGDRRYLRFAPLTLHYLQEAAARRAGDAACLARFAELVGGLQARATPGAA